MSKVGDKHIVHDQHLLDKRKALVYTRDVSRDYSVSLLFLMYWFFFFLVLGGGWLEAAAQQMWSR